MASINPDRWRILSRYLDDVLELPPEQRAGWLADVSARDAALGADLQRLLREHDQAHKSGFLEGAVLDHRTVPPPSLTGTVVGDYRLLSPIGQGGTGSVWLAERCDGRFEGRAAVKLLNVALLNRNGEERFRREGTILARVRHPHIAHLIDAGITEHGQPYLVLEYVDGQPIDRYCDTHGLSIEARLQLFLDVLEAVAHAHANLIVHRDIKPANVLVGADGRVKLLDFGIAKLVEPETAWTSDGSPAAPTRDGGLTPEYAAPEQLAGGTVTTATDVYGLGVLLYTLLSGQHPAGGAVRSPATLVRAIVESEPPRLSDVVVSRAADDDGAVARHAATCGTTPDRLRRTLRGDLDTIVGRALKKSPAERYGSVTAMADDVRRFLRREPIHARPDTLGYRAARFVERHARAVAAAAAAVVLIAALTAIYTVRLATARDQAQREAAKATKVSELVIGLLTSADPYATRTGRGEQTVRGLLDAGAVHVQKELASEPDVQAEILTMIGRTYRRLGEYERAQQVLGQALASGEQAFGTNDVRVAQALHDLGVVFADKGDYAAAARSLERALDLRRRLLGREHADVAVTLAELGRVYQDEGFNGRAEPLHREALAIREQLLGPGHRETAVSQSDLASVLRLNGDLAGADALLRVVLETNRATRGPDHPNTAVTLHDLAVIAGARGEHVQAEAGLRQALAIQRRAFGDRHPTMAMTLNSLSHTLVETRRLDEAQAALHEAMDIVRQTLGDEHQLLAIYAFNGAAVHLARRDAATAERLLREGLRVRARAPTIVPYRRRTVPADDWSVAAANSLLGAALTVLARFDEAETLLLEARRDLEAQPARRPGDLETTFRRLSDLYAAWGKPERAANDRAHWR